MQTFEQIQQQIVDLQKQADAMRKQAVSAAIKEIKRLVNLYNLSYAELGLAPVVSVKASINKASATQASSKAHKTSKKASADKRSSVAPKYRDPETGETWSGRGKPPTWMAAKLAAGATKESFKI